MEQKTLFDEVTPTEAQRAAYGKDQWDRDFVCAAQATHDAPEVQRAFRTLPISRHKIFQLLFCEEAYRAVPRYMKQGPAVHFVNEQHISNLPIAACLVDPNYISDTLAENLHLAAFEKGEPAASRQRKKEASIPRLKEIFSHVSRIDPETNPGRRNARLLFINGDSDPRIDGQILLTRHHAGSDAMYLQIYPDLYTAYRKTFHQHDTHAREMHDLTTMQANIRAFNQKVDREWRKNVPAETKAKLVAEANTLRDSSIQYLEDAINTHKVKARDLIDQLRDLRIRRFDHRDIVNPSAAMARMVAIMGQLAQRMEDVHGIDHANTLDRLVLRQAMIDGENTLQGLRQRLGNIQYYWRTKGSFPTTPLIIENVKKNLWVDTLKHLRIQPFRSVGRALEEHLHMLPAILAERKKSAFLQHLTMMHQTAHQFLQHLQIAENGLVYFDPDAKPPPASPTPS